MNFDRVARTYQVLETTAFGNALQRARACWLDRISTPKRALIVGQGNGRFLCELLRRQPQLEIDCVDASERMLALAKERVQQAGADSLHRVQFLKDDVLTWVPSNSYDLLVTHFFLDCFRSAELQLIVQKLANATTTGATWLIADFSVPSAGIARIHAKLWLHAMYAFFQIAAGLAARQLVDPGPYLYDAGFHLLSSQSFRFGMLQSAMYRRGG